MSIEKIYGHISCADLRKSTAWFAKLFGRSPDANPMAGLAEWNFDDKAGVQLFQEPNKAGASTLTLGVDDLEEERARLAREGLNPGAAERAKDFQIVRLTDPDGNLVVLAGAG